MDTPQKLTSFSPSVYPNTRIELYETETLNNPLFVHIFWCHSDVAAPAVPYTPGVTSLLRLQIRDVWVKLNLAPNKRLSRSSSPLWRRLVAHFSIHRGGVLIDRTIWRKGGVARSGGKRFNRARELCFLKHEWPSHTNKFEGLSLHLQVRSGIHMI